MSERPKRPTTVERLNGEWDRLHRSVREGQPLVEPTDDEKRNGWTAETLTAYLAERKTAQSLNIDKDSLHSRLARMPARQNNRYSPLRWRA